MFESKVEWAYATMACFLKEEYKMPGVEDAFTMGSYCESRYRDIWDAYARIREKLGVKDEDEDMELIIGAFEDVQRELCFRMYHYGAKFGE